VLVIPWLRLQAVIDQHGAAPRRRHGPRLESQDLNLE
jgi:hypothetical protein